MGWSGTEEFAWGDIPQDIIDNAIDRKFKKRYKWKDFVDEIPYRTRLQIAAILLRDKRLRAKVDKAYQEEFDRPATDKEFRNLLRVGLFLKGRTSVPGR